MSRVWQALILGMVAQAARSAEDCKRTDSDDDNTHVVFLQISLNETFSNSSAPGRYGNTQGLLGSGANTPVVESGAFALASVSLGHGRSKTSPRPLSLVGLARPCRESWITEPRTSLMFTCLAVSTMIVLFLVFGFWCRSTPQQNPGGAPSSSKPRSSDAAVKMYAIEGLRVLFTIQVICYHEHVPVFFATKAISHGVMQFFFVTSGFVNMLSEDGKTELFSYKQGISFFLKRCVRLVPLCWLALLILAISNFGAVDIVLEKWPLQAVFAQSLFPWDFCNEIGPLQWVGTLWGANMVSWFVSDLLIISFFFPVLFNYCPGRLRSIICLLTVVVIARTLLGRLSAVFFGNNDGLNLFVPPHFADFTYCFIPLRGLEFAAGMLSAKLCGRLRQHTWQCLEGGFWGVLFDVSLVSSIAVMVLFGPEADPRPDHNHGDIYLTGVFSLTCICAYFASLQSKGNFMAEGFIGKCLTVAPLQWLVTYTYPAFILQFTVFQYFHPKLFEIIPRLRDLGPELSSLITLGECLVIGIIAQLVFQEPLQRVLTSYLRGK